jgi:hypothetical protein
MQCVHFVSYIFLSFRPIIKLQQLCHLWTNRKNIFENGKKFGFLTFVRKCTQWLSVAVRCCVTESSASVLGVSAAVGCRVIPCSQVTKCGKQNDHSMSLRCSVNLEYLDYILSRFLFLFYALSPLGWGESVDRRILLLADLHTYSEVISSVSKIRFEAHCDLC